MASLNKVVLIGNLTRDPELRYTPSGAAVAKFGLAMNRKYKQGDDWKEEVTFVDIVVWGKQGENCSEYLSKGRQVAIDGRLSYSSWESDEGQRRSKIDVVGERVVFLGSAGGGGSRSQDGPASKPEPSKGGGSSYDDDVPF